MSSQSQTEGLAAISFNAHVTILEQWQTACPCASGNGTLAPHVAQRLSRTDQHSAARSDLATEEALLLTGLPHNYHDMS